MTQVLIREIKETDNDFVKHLVLDVLKEFGAVGPGYASSDSELDDMCNAYKGDHKNFYILEVEGKRVGAAGFAPLRSIENNMCELRKMYLNPASRGLGLGKKLIKHCMQEARIVGYQSMYLETMSKMKAAQSLYQANGFKYLENRLGDTGHHSCPVFMLAML